MKIFFQGGEQPGWRRMLLDEGVQNISLSFTYFHRRVSKKNWRLPEYPEGTSLLMDAGGYTANKNPGQLDADGWREYEQDYMDFVELNQDRLDIVTEFDCLALGAEHIDGMRGIWRNALPPEQLLVVWHGETSELQEMAKRYRRIGVPAAGMDAPGVAQRINGLEREFGTQFHGLAVTKPDTLRDVHFATAASTSWLSPSQFGDSIIWDGQRLKRYPKKYKAQARKRHKLAFAKAGFDADKILADDPTELTRFTIWSWMRYEESLNRPGGVTQPVAAPGAGLADVGPASVGRPPAVWQPRGEEQQLLPVFGFGEMDLPQIESRSLRKCSTCYVAANCPAFQPEAECAYAIPLSLSSRDEMLSFLRGVIEMQGHRVLFGRFVEELEGGYPDPNLSGEIDRLLKLVRELRDIEDNRDSLKISMEARSGAGVLSRLFGKTAPTPLPHVLDMGQTNELLAQAIDVE